MCTNIVSTYLFEPRPYSLMDNINSYSYKRTKLIDENAKLFRDEEKNSVRCRGFTIFVEIKTLFFDF